MLGIYIEMQLVAFETDSKSVCVDNDGLKTINQGQNNPRLQPNSW